MTLGPGAAEEERVAVRRRLRDELRADRPGGARPVVDDDLLAERRGERLGHDARHRVRRAGRRRRGRPGGWSGWGRTGRTAGWETSDVAAMSAATAAWIPRPLPNDEGGRCCGDRPVHRREVTASSAATLAPFNSVLHRVQRRALPEPLDLRGRERVLELEQGGRAVGVRRPGMSRACPASGPRGRSTIRGRLRGSCRSPPDR